MADDPTSYVYGVPVKITEKYRPPRKVTIPPPYNVEEKAETLFVGVSMQCDVRVFNNLHW